MIGWLSCGVVLLGIYARWTMPARRRLRGRWISRPLRRVLGPARLAAAKACLRHVTGIACLSWTLLWLLGAARQHDPLFAAAWGLLIAEGAWDADDWLTGDDDDRKRRPLAWARARLASALRPLGYSTSTGGRA